MRITKQTLGAIVGVVLLIVALFTVSYAFTAFIFWQLSPALWAVEGRLTALGVFVALIVAWFLFTQVQVVEDEDA